MAFHKVYYICISFKTKYQVRVILVFRKKRGGFYGKRIGLLAFKNLVELCRGNFTMHV